MGNLARLCLPFCLIAAMAAAARAQETDRRAVAKVGVIDVQRLVTESKRGEELLDRLKRLRQQKSAEGEALKQQIQDLEARILDGRLSDSVPRVAEMEKQLEEKVIELRRFSDDTDRVLKSERDRAFARIEREVMPIIARIGQEQGFTLLFNKYESGLVFATERMDITDLILQRYDAEVEAEGADS